jgi:apolipoprotein N-acyltransferase
MNQLSKFGRSISFVILTLLSTFVTFAQDETPSLDVNIITNGGAFYTQIWFWVIIGLVFILLLVALLRGSGGKKD